MGYLSVSEESDRLRGVGVNKLAFCRSLGWMLVILAVVMASAEAVMALGAGEYSGLATSEVWALIVGEKPRFVVGEPDFIAMAGASILAMPAWVVFGVVGIALAHFFRKRRNRRLFRS